ncbi:MAG: methyltransferase domain-containing protein [Acidobacteria bacterium]|nr:methyltransferase domain-containing protein [Acidobacteriota bacterium]
MRLGVVTPLRPAPPGPSVRLTQMLPWLAKSEDIEFFVPDAAMLDPSADGACRVRPLGDRHDPSIDMLLYECPDTLDQPAVVRAALDGPPGLVLVHDPSLHGRLRGALDPPEFDRLLVAAHGESARGSGREDFDPEGIGPSLFDCLAPALDRHRGAVVHDEHTADLLGLRCPGLPVFVVPDAACPADPAPAERETLGLPADRILIGHIGDVVSPRAAEELVTAVAGFLEPSSPVHLVLAGEDSVASGIERIIERRGLRDRVTVARPPSPEETSSSIALLDIIVSAGGSHAVPASWIVSRALAAGRATVILDLERWAGIPAEACVKIEAFGDRTRKLARALEGLVRNPAARRSIGDAARRYALRELEPVACAGKLLEAARVTASGPRESAMDCRRARAAEVDTLLAAGPRRVLEYLGPSVESTPRSLLDHVFRYHETLRDVPPAPRGARLLDIGSQPALLRILARVWGYEVRGCGLPSGVDPRTIHVLASGGLPPLDLVVDAVDVEREALPYAPGSFDVVTCWEVLEHLQEDPMHMLWEINRVLKPRGILILTTPNTASLRSVRAVLRGEHPGIWTPYMRAGHYPRHQREYTPKEIRRLLAAAGLSSDRVSTRLVWESRRDTETSGVLARIGASTEDRGDDILAVARKASLPLERVPAPLYDRLTDPLPDPLA